MMKVWSLWPVTVLVALLALSVPVHGSKMVKTNALMSCMANSQFTASKFDVVLYPDNKTVTFDISAISTIEGNVTAKVQVIAYGITIVDEQIDACTLGVPQLCPIASGRFDVASQEKLSGSILDHIPGIAYAIPDLDGKVKIQVYQNNDKSKAIACVQATLSNGKTVQTKWASWAMGIVCALGLLTAGIINVIGYYSTAAHIASNTVSLFEYFQAVAIVAMAAVDDAPPIAAAWVQNFQWSVGIMRVKFMQSIFNWYVQATGGKAANIIPNSDVLSIEVEKRSVPAFNSIHSVTASALGRAVSYGFQEVPRAAKQLLFRRDTSVTSDEFSNNLSSSILVLRGIKRVAFLAQIEITSLFLTGLTFFIILGVFLMLALLIFKGVIEIIARSSEHRATMFSDYRRGWLTQMKGVLVRLVLIGFPALSVLCLWELTERDSVATVIMAVIAWLTVAGVLGFAAFRVITIARRSQMLHKNPAYILFSDPACLNKWGFLYIQFRATAYYFICVIFGYSLLKACFIAFGQNSGKAQAMGIFLIELGYLVTLCWLKPYMDKRTNGFNIAISAINFINSIFFLFFSYIFNQPDSVNGIAAVVFFVLNALFSLILLIMIIVSCVWAWFSSNPDNRYQPMRDDRESFIRDANPIEKRQGTELDALGASARDGYSPDRDSLDGFNSGKNASQASFQQQDIFPQARLPRKAGPGDYLPSSSQGGYTHVGDGYGYNEPLSRTDSPSFPQETSYHGYQPQGPAQFYNPAAQRQPPRF